MVYTAVTMDTRILLMLAISACGLTTASMIGNYYHYEKAGCSALCDSESDFQEFVRAHRNDTLTTPLSNNTCRCVYRWCFNLEPLTLAANVIGLYISPFVVVVGFIGNLLSMAVMIQPRHRKTSFGVYLFALAIADNFCLLTWTGRIVYMYSTANGLTDLGCKIDIGVKYTFRTMGYLIILMLTADRYVIVCMPLKAVYWCRADRAIVVSVVAFLVSLAAAGPNFFLQNQNHKRTYACTMTDNVAFYNVYTLAVLMSLVVIFVCIMAMNVIVIWTIKRRMKYRGVCSSHRAMGFTRRVRYDSEMTVTPTNSIDNSSSLDDKVKQKKATPAPETYIIRTSGLSRTMVNKTTGHSVESLTTTSAAPPPSCNRHSGLVTPTSSPVQRRRARTRSEICTDCSKATRPISRRDRNLITILRLVSFTFLVLNLSQLLRVSVMKWVRLDSSHKSAISYLAFQITNNLCNVNYAINFGLYCYSGSRFRADLKKMILALCDKMKLTALAAAI